MSHTKEEAEKKSKTAPKTQETGEGTNKSLTCVCLVFSCLVLSCSCFPLSYLCLDLPCRLAMSCLDMSYLILSCHVLSCLVLSCLVLSGLALLFGCLVVLSCVALSCSVAGRFLFIRRFNGSCLKQNKSKHKRLLALVIYITCLLPVYWLSPYIAERGRRHCLPRLRFELGL